MTGRTLRWQLLSVLWSGRLVRWPRKLFRLREIQFRSHRKGNGAASFDRVIHVLVGIGYGRWLPYESVRTNDAYYLQERIEVQSLSDRTNNFGEEVYVELNKEKRRLFKRLTKRLLHLYRNFASQYQRDSRLRVVVVCRTTWQSTQSL